MDIFRFINSMYSNSIMILNIIWGFIFRVFRHSILIRIQNQITLWQIECLLVRIGFASSLDIWWPRIFGNKIFLIFVTCSIVLMFLSTHERFFQIFGNSDDNNNTKNTNLLRNKTLKIKINKENTTYQSQKNYQAHTASTNSD